MYFVLAICAGFIGGTFSVLIRMELQLPGLQIFTDPHVYNAFVTGHGLIMIFFTLMPAMMGGFGNWMGHFRLRRCSTNSKYCLGFREIIRKDCAR